MRRLITIGIGVGIVPWLAAAVTLDPGSLPNPNPNNFSALLITIDEMGVGSYRTITAAGSPGPSGPLGFHIGPADGLPAVLIYDLPVLSGNQLQVQNGWLQVMDAGPLGPVVGDEIHFHGGTICFYSDRDMGQSEFPPGFADVDVLPSPGPNDLVRMVNEVGPEGANGATYVAINDPGPPATPTTATYRIISDVPEPGPVFLTGGWLILALIFRTLARFAARQEPDGRASTQLPG